MTIKPGDIEVGKTVYSHGGKKVKGTKPVGTDKSVSTMTPPSTAKPDSKHGKPDEGKNK